MTRQLTYISSNWANNLWNYPTETKKCLLIGITPCCWIVRMFMKITKTRFGSHLYCKHPQSRECRASRLPVDIQCRPAWVVTVYNLLLIIYKLWLSVCVFFYVRLFAPTGLTQWFPYHLRKQSNGSLHLSVNVLVISKTDLVAMITTNYTDLGIPQVDTHRPTKINWTPIIDIDLIWLSANIFQSLSVSPSLYIVIIITVARQITFIWTGC